MTIDPNSLISGYLDGTLSSTEAQALCAWVKASPDHALRFSRRALVHGLSREYFVAQDVTPIAESDGDDFDRLLDAPPAEINVSLVLDEVRKSLESQRRRSNEQAQRERMQREAFAERQQLQQAMLGFGDTLRPVRHIVIPRFALYAVGAALAAVVVLLAYPMLFPERSQPAPAVQPPTAAPVYVATLVHASDAQWADEATPIRAGSRLASGVVRLLRGHVRLTMDNGAELELIAPATIDLRHPGEVMLDAGTLIGRCPPQAVGFTVHTPGGRIVDLGTEFGVIVDDDRTTTASVFLGHVEVATKSMSASQSLRAGEAAVVMEDADAIVNTSFDAKPFVAYRPYLDLLHRNLIVNGDFEAGPHVDYIIDEQGMSRTVGWQANAIPGWVDETIAGTMRYADALQRENVFRFAADRLPPERGEAFFFGRAAGTTWQQIYVGDLANLIDSGSVGFELSGWLGGHINQNDRCEIRALFLNASEAAMRTEQIGPVTNIDRNNETGFQFRRQNGSVPKGTRFVRIEVVSYQDVHVVDGFADNVSLILTTNEN